MPVDKSYSNYNSINDQNLQPHMRNNNPAGSSVTSFSSNDSGNTTALPFVYAAESVNQGHAIHINSSGLGEIANDTTKPASLIAGNAASIGEKIYYKQAGEVFILDASFTKRVLVWLCTGIVNITSDLPGLVTGHIVQSLGTSLTTNSILVNIGRAEKIT